MGAGKRNQVVTIQSKTLSTDAWGAPAEASWSTHKTVFAHVITQRGREFVSEGREDTAQHNISVIFDYVSGLNEAMRLLWNGETYEIVSVMAIRERNETQINAIWTEGRA